MNPSGKTAVPISNAQSSNKDATDAQPTLQQQVYHSLREDIMLGRFQPGRSVTIRGLAETLGTSMMPVREALRRLVAERALELRANRRVSVPEMTEKAFRELTDARIALETLAARHALPFVDDDLVREMDRIDDEQDQAIRNGDIAAYLEHNRSFHFHLYGRAPGGVLMPMIESLWLQIGPFLYLTHDRLGVTYVADRHKQAIAALESRDEDALARAIEEDIRDGMGSIPKEALPPSTL